MAIDTTSTPNGHVAPPFPLTADPRDFWEGPPYRETLLALRQAVRENRGALVLTGDIGCGKTMLANVLADGFRREGAIVGALSHPQVDAFELLQAIARGLGLTTPFDSRAAFTSMLREFIADARAANRVVLVIVDEAQSLSHEALAEIAQLPLGDRDGTPGLTVLLAGQETLQTTLREPEHAALAERIAGTFRLRLLAEDDVAHYVRHQLRRAGIEQPAFESAALREIAAASGGNPRLINTLSDVALGIARTQGFQIIRAKLVRQCAVDMAATSRVEKVEAPSPRSHPPRSHARRSGRSRSASPSRYTFLLVALGVTAVAVASFSLTSYVLTRLSGGPGRPAAAGVVVPPERRLAPSEPRTGTVAPAVTAVDPPAAATSPAAPVVAPAALTPTPPPVAPTVSAPRPASPVATPPVARSRSPLPPPVESRRAAPVAKALVPPTPASPAPPPAVEVPPRPQSSEPDPGAIIDWMLTNAPARRTALPDPVPTGR